MTPKVAQAEYLDVTAAMDQGAIGKEISFNILTDIFESGEETQ
jgi:hypothetical protein